MGTRVSRPIIKEKQIWFEDYDPVATDLVLLDDFRGEMGLGYMLQLLDGYQLMVERKGASVLFKPNVIVITSNDEPDRWWPGKDLAPFWRRVSEGGGTYCLWVERPRIQGANGRIVQEGGLVRTYPQGGAPLPEDATAPVAGASAMAPATTVHFRYSTRRVACRGVLGNIDTSPFRSCLEPGHPLGWDTGPQPLLAPVAYHPPPVASSTSATEMSSSTFPIPRPIFQICLTLKLTS